MISQDLSKGLLMCDDEPVAPHKSLRVVKDMPNRPVRHLGTLKREDFDDSWRGKQPQPGPHLKLAMLAWIAARHNNDMPNGVPTGAVRGGFSRNMIIVIVMLFVCFLAFVVDRVSQPVVEKPTIAGRK